MATPTLPSEKELTERARRGDIAAFEELVRAHRTKIFSFALNIAGGRRDLAQDIMQEALIHAYRGIASFRGDCSFSSWLWRILKNDLLRHRERSAAALGSSLKETGTIADHRTPTAEETLIREDRFLHLRAIIAQMSIDDQEALTLVEFQELPFEEAARLLGIPVDTLKPRLFRARQRLAELVMKNKDLFL